MPSLHSCLSVDLIAFGARLGVLQRLPRPQAILQFLCSFLTLFYFPDSASQAHLPKDLCLVTSPTDPFEKISLLFRGLLQCDLLRKPALRNLWNPCLRPALSPSTPALFFCITYYFPPYYKFFYLVYYYFPQLV